MLGFYSLSEFFQVLINGVLFGTMYGLAAIGLSLIFGSMQIIFIAQGSVMILAAYFAYWAFTILGIDPYVSILLSIPVFFCLGWLIYNGLFKRISKEGKNTTLLLAFGLMILLENVMSFAWTPNARTISTTYAVNSFDIFDVNISVTRLMAFVIGVAATGILFVFLKKNIWGKALRGASEDMMAASLLGISPAKINSLTFSLGIVLAGVAGVVTASVYPFSPYYGFVFSIKALIAVAFGGLGSVIGAMFGGVLLGVLESLGGYMISTGWADAISYAAFLIVLILKPEGLFTRSSTKA